MFAALALLRCRDRLKTLLDAVAEPRRASLAAALGEFDGLDDARLKQILADIVQREDQVLVDVVARSLGRDIAKAPRVVRIWVARGAKR
jgi:hypothetical protein